MPVQRSTSRIMRIAVCALAGWKASTASSARVMSTAVPNVDTAEMKASSRSPSRRRNGTAMSDPGPPPAGSSLCTPG